MPSVSKKQHNFMAAVAKNPGFAKKVGIPAKVGQEFLTADKGKKFGSGGTMKKKMRKFDIGGEVAGMGADVGKKLKRQDVLSGLGKAASSGLNAGQMAAGLGAGIGKGLSSMGRKKYEAPNEDSDYKKGGKVHSDIAKDKPMMKKVAAKAVKGHEKRLHGMAKGGGIEVKGKTKGKMIKMAKGGRAC